MTATSPRVLFVSLTNDVGSDRVVIETGAQGAACAVLGPPGAYAGLPRCVVAHFPMPIRLGSLGKHILFSKALSRAVTAWAPDWLVPLDDLAATLSRALGSDPRSPPHVRALIEHSLGALSGFEAACQRVALMEAARSARVRTPPFASADGWARDAQTVRSVGFPLMVKRDQSSGSGGVVRVNTEAELAAAVRGARLRTIAKVGLARLGGFHRSATPVLLQRVVEGRLAMFTAACRHGRMVDGIGFEAVEMHPTNRASTVLRHMDHAGMAEAARRLVDALGCSGFVSFDFIIDRAGRAFLIEMNPRPIGSTHLGRCFGHDLVRAFLTGESAAAPPTLGNDARIALFPKELERDPLSPYLALDPSVMFDMPENETAVVFAYLAHLKALHPAHADDLDRLPDLIRMRPHRPTPAAEYTARKLPLAS